MPVVGGRAGAPVPIDTTRVRCSAHVQVPRRPTCTCICICVHSASCFASSLIANPAHPPSRARAGRSRPRGRPVAVGGSHARMRATTTDDARESACMACARPTRYTLQHGQTGAAARERHAAAEHAILCATTPRKHHVAPNSCSRGRRCGHRISAARVQHERPFHRHATATALEKAFAICARVQHNTNTLPYRTSCAPQECQPP